MEGRVSHNKKSAALILSVLLPFSPTPRLYGDPFDKKHKDPKGAGGVKKCNGDSGAATRPGFGGSLPALLLVDLPQSPLSPL